MAVRNWKRLSPLSLLEAMRLCKDHAREKRSLSVERIAELMGVTPDALYKWLGTGRMPANLIPAYEHVCGINYVSRYLAVSAGKLVIDMPTGRAVQPCDTQELQTILNSAVGAILKFATGKVEAQEALAEIQAGMGCLGWHHHNITNSQQPELELDQPNLE